MSQPQSTSPMSVKLDAAVRDRLNAVAARHKRTAHAVAREAIEAYIEREEILDAANQSALASWRHFQETGLHVTGEEVAAWIETWGTPGEAKAPLCHE